MGRGYAWSFRIDVNYGKQWNPRKLQRGGRKVFQYTPEHSFLDGRFQYSLASCLPIFVYSSCCSLLAVSCIFVFLTPPPWCLFFERKGGTELNFHLRADGWVTDIKVGPDHQGSLKMRATSGTEVQPSQELSAFLNPFSWNTCSQLFRRN